MLTNVCKDSSAFPVCTEVNQFVLTISLTLYCLLDIWTCLTQWFLYWSLLRQIWCSRIFMQTNGKLSVKLNLQLSPGTSSECKCTNTYSLAFACNLTSRAPSSITDSLDKTVALPCTLSKQNVNVHFQWWDTSLAALNCWNLFGQMCISVTCVTIIFFPCIPQLYLCGSPFSVRFLCMCPCFFNPIIELVTFCLCGLSP